MLPYGLKTGVTARLPGDLVVRPKAKAKRTDLADTFTALWGRLAADAPIPQREFQFHPVRKWRIDVAWPAVKLAVELEGMTAGGGRHQRWSGFNADAEKYRELTKAGWRLLRYTGDDLRKRPIQCVEEVKQLLHELEPKP